VGKPRWHRVYYLLVAFDVFTVLVSLYLNHRTVAIYTRSVAVNQAWFEILEDSSRLGELAAAINAPGNDVFASGQVEVESEKMAAARRQFDAHLEALRDKVRTRAPSRDASLEEVHEALRGAAAAMADESVGIFAAFRRGHLEEAGRRMAEMDRKYNAVNTALGRLRAQVGAIQQEQLAREAAGAESLQRYAYAVAVLVILMLAGATLYGRQMARHVEEATRQREEYVAGLRRAQEALEDRVRERTAELEEANGALRRSEERARGFAEERTRLLEQVMTAQEDERRRIARDLHDEVGQSLTSLLIGLRTMRERPSGGVDEQRVGDLHAVAAAALDEVRRLARGLRPATLDDLGLAAALERYTADYAQATGVPVRLEAAEGDLGRLPGAVETALYRIVQEALTNVSKHAAARNVRVAVARRAATVEVVVEDDGRGFDAAAVLCRPPAARLGLTGLRERAALLGGEAAITSAPGRGTRVTVRIPLTGGDHGQDPGADRG
jgi:signal transduction histidine kinase